MSMRTFMSPSDMIDALAELLLDRREGGLQFLVVLIFFGHREPPMILIANGADRAKRTVGMAWSLPGAMGVVKVSSGKNLPYQEAGRNPLVSPPLVSWLGLEESLILLFEPHECGRGPRWVACKEVLDLRNQVTCDR